MLVILPQISYCKFKQSIVYNVLLELLQFAVCNEKICGKVHKNIVAFRF